jgi:ATP-binding cassette, subfamily B, bacterial
MARSAAPPRPSRAAWRGIRLLWRSSPRAVGGLLVVQVLTGVAPAIVVATSATLIDRAPHAAESLEARRATVIALVVLAGALVVGRAASALVGMLHSVTSYRFGAAVDSLRLEAAGALPGLAHFDSPQLANRLQAGQWASAASAMVNYGGFFARHTADVVARGVVAARIGWWAPVLVIATAIPGCVSSWRHAAARKAAQLRWMTAQRQATYYADLAVGLQPAREVRLFGLGAWLLDRQRRRWSDASGPVLETLAREMRHGLLISAAKWVVLALPFVVAYQALVDGELSSGSFAAAVVALGAMVGHMRLIETFPGEARAAAQFLPELFDLADLAAADPRLSVRGCTSPPSTPALGLAFEGVRFTYPGGDRPVLDGLDLWLPGGASLALVGVNGAGKSTLVKLLCRFYDPDEGRITLDGVDLREFDLGELRRRLAVVFQDFTRLPLTAAENIGVGCVERMEELPLLAAAARRAGADELIAGLPGGWGTVLDRQFGGVDLSGGEWQRIALARALATQLGRGASVLVLDEPTAALDVRLEHDLYQRFASLTSGCTTVLVSHRFSTVRMADKVAVVEGGRVCEHGTHAELVAVGGRYAELYELQARRFRETGAVG